MAQPKPQKRSVPTYPLRLSRRSGNKLSLLNFHRETDFRSWKKVEMTREDNRTIHNAGLREEAPEFGAGSVYRQKEREELRRAKFTNKQKEYKEEDQPWLFKATSDTARHFRGVKGGGVNTNSDYFIFSQTTDGIINVIPVDEWYNFQAHSRFKALDADEAEEQFSRRDKTLNFFSLKCKLKLKAEKEEQEKEEEEKVKKAAKASLTISEMDEWISSGDSSDDEGDEMDDEEGSRKRKKAKAKAKISPKNKKRKYDKHSEAMEESDDGDEEGREREYISDSSDSEPEDLNLGSVAEEKGLKKLLTEEMSESSDSSSDEEKSEKEEEIEEEIEMAKPEKKEEKKSQKTQNGDGLFDKFSSDSEEEGVKESKQREKKKKKGSAAKKTSKVERKAPSVPSQPENLKEKVLNHVLSTIRGTRPNPDLPLPAMSSSTNQQEEVKSKNNSLESMVTINDVKKYLLRKPITMKDLLLKFKSKGFAPERVSAHVGEIMKKLRPISQYINGKTYFSINN